MVDIFVFTCKRFKTRFSSQDILEFIDDSPHGVIYFTFGSTVSMSSLPESVHRAFVEALGRVPQRVLWKYEGEMKDKPKNVMTKKWFPQRDILCNVYLIFFFYKCSTFTEVNICARTGNLNINALVIAKTSNSFWDHVTRNLNSG